MFTVLQEFLGVVVDPEVESEYNEGEDSEEPDQLAVQAGLGQISETMESRLLAVQNAWGRGERGEEEQS